MTKTFRLIESELRHVDILIELLDARIPLSSKNPQLASATANKPRLLVLNKSDLADERATKAWESFYRDRGYGALSLSSRDKRGPMKAVDAALALLTNKDAISGKKRLAKPAAMVIGVPNVGKSTFINALAGSTRAKAEDRPGVTRGKQWISLPRIELLDMPGVLWKKLENQNGALLLAFTGAIKDGVLDGQEISACLLGLLKRDYSEMLKSRYKLDDSDLDQDNFELLSEIARHRGMLMPGGIPDTERAAAMVLDELRAGKLGNITFEEAPR